MTWDIAAPYKAESKKVCWHVAPYLRGRGLDVGAGDFKVLPHAISVDNMNHAQFGFSVRPDVFAEADDLSMFASQSMDFVYSSHTLEHITDYPKALAEWFRVVKQGGYLILYLPDEDEYPRVGEPGANPDHKWNVNYDKVVAAMQQLKGWDLVEFEKRNKTDEYSLLFVFKKINSKHNQFSYQKPKPTKTACVVRYGAFGDLMQASSVWAELKKQGYHVTVFSSLPGADVIKHDPNIDNLVLFDKDQVPNGNLVDFWDYQRTLFDKFVNLSESVEGTLLAMRGRTLMYYPPELRHKLMNFNYVEQQHEIAQVPFSVPNTRFYTTAEEREWAKKTRAKMGEGPVVLWSLAGSSVHKAWPYLDNTIARILLTYPTARVVLVGGPECAILEGGWENEPRVVCKSGVWSIRETLSFLTEADLVVGVETGVLNAASMLPVPKVIFLSHSTEENLTRDWVNTTSLWSKSTKCPGRGDGTVPACHMLHYGWDFCKQDKTTSTAQCQADISVDAAWAAINKYLLAVKRMALEAA